jgi:DNA-binding MarR family transcriptional regulator
MREALTLIIGAWIKSERYFQRSNVWPIQTARDGLRLDRLDYVLLRELIYGGPRRLSDLARVISLTNSHTSRVVDNHVRRGLLSRTVPDDDRRVTIIDVSPTGRAVGRAVEDEFKGLLAARLANFDEPDIVKFAELFTRFSDEVAGWAEESARADQPAGTRGNAAAPLH